MPEQTLQPTGTPTLSPALELALELRVTQFFALKAQRDELAQGMDALKDAIHRDMDAEGLSSAKVSNGSLTWITGSVETLDKNQLKRALVAAGLTLDQVEAMFAECTARKPKKPYLDIRPRSDHE